MKIAWFAAISLIVLSLAGLALFVIVGLNSMVYAWIEGEYRERPENLARSESHWVLSTEEP